VGEWDGIEYNSAKCTSAEGDKNSSRVTSERVVENSSQDVSPFVEMEARVEVRKGELVAMISETITGGMGDEPSGKRELIWGDASSGVATEEEDGDGGGTVFGWEPRDGRRIS